MDIDNIIILCCLFGIGYSIIQMMKEVKLRGIDYNISGNFLSADNSRDAFLRLITFMFKPIIAILAALKYTLKYIMITRQETGRVGWLFYVFAFSVLMLFSRLFF